MGNIRKTIIHAVDFCGKIYLFLACIMLIICVSGTVVCVFSRYVLSTPLDWGEEVAALTQAWMVCLMIPQMDIHYDHIMMEIVFNAVNKKIRFVIRILQSLITCALSAYLLSFTIDVLKMNAKLKTVTGTLLIPYSIVYLALLATFVFMLIVHVGKLLTADYCLPEEQDSSETEDSV